MIKLLLSNKGFSVGVECVFCSNFASHINNETHNEVNIDGGWTYWKSSKKISMDVNFREKSLMRSKIFA